MRRAISRGDGGASPPRRVDDTRWEEPPVRLGMTQLLRFTGTPHFLRAAEHRWFKRAGLLRTPQAGSPRDLQEASSVDVPIVVITIPYGVQGATRVGSKKGLGLL